MNNPWGNYKIHHCSNFASLKCLPISQRNVHKCFFFMIIGPVKAKDISTRDPGGIWKPTPAMPRQLGIWSVCCGLLLCFKNCIFPSIPKSHHDFFVWNANSCGQDIVNEHPLLQTQGYLYENGIQICLHWNFFDKTNQQLSIYLV